MGAEAARGPDERAEQRMRLERPGFELGVKLAAEVPGVVLYFANFHVGAIRRFAGDPEAVRGQYFLEFAVKFVAMPMALADRGYLVRLSGEGAGFQHARPRAEAHRPAQFVDPFQLAEFVDHALGRGRVEFR